MYIPMKQSNIGQEVGEDPYPRHDSSERVVTDPFPKHSGAVGMKRDSQDKEAAAHIASMQQPRLSETR